jgi:hypothetical protein
MIPRDEVDADLLKKTGKKSAVSCRVRTPCVIKESAERFMNPTATADLYTAEPAADL